MSTNYIFCRFQFLVRKSYVCIELLISSLSSCNPRWFGHAATWRHDICSNWWNNPFCRSTLLPFTNIRIVIPSHSYESHLMWIVLKLDFRISLAQWPSLCQTSDWVNYNNKNLASSVKLKLMSREGTVSIPGSYNTHYVLSILDFVTIEEMRIH